MKQVKVIEKIKKEFPDQKISQQFLSLVLNGKRRLSWEKAKVLAVLTGTTPDFWMEGEPEELKKAILDLE